MKEKYFLKINDFNENLSNLEKYYSKVVNKLYSTQEKKNLFYEVLNNFKLQIK